MKDELGPKVQAKAQGMAAASSLSVLQWNLALHSTEATLKRLDDQRHSVSEPALAVDGSEARILITYNYIL